MMQTPVFCKGVKIAMIHFMAQVETIQPTKICEKVQML